jgi:hypothetical protein
MNRFWQIFVANSFEFRYLFDHFTVLLDANPTRFLFTNAVAWNTLISALDSVELITFRLIKQAVYVLMMAKNLSNPATLDGLVEIICPDLEPKLVFYMLKNFRPDEMMPDTINPSVFRDRYQIPDIPTLQAVVPKSVLDYRPAGESLNLAAWNQVTLTPAITRQYPFLTEQVKGTHP